MGITCALSLAKTGLPCFPCRADKRPATPRGFIDATCDQHQLRELWVRHPGPLVGMPTGEISGLDVLDIDPRHNGECWFAEQKHRLLPTRVNRTRSGGLHLLYQHEPGLRCSVGKITAGVDVGASGGYLRSKGVPPALLGWQQQFDVYSGFGNCSCGRDGLGQQETV